MATDAHAQSFFRYARAYQKAANLLYATDDRTSNAPFLYFHSIESGLKAFLRSRSVWRLALSAFRQIQAAKWRRDDNNLRPFV